MPRKKSDEAMELNEFLGELIEAIDTRLRRQEKAISGLREQLDLLGRRAGRRPARASKIDDAVMKILKE